MRKYFMTALIVAAAMSGGCGRKAGNYVTLNGLALGTTYHFVLNMPDTTGLREAINGLFSEVTSSMSVYDPGSLLNRLNRNETDLVDKHIAYCIETAAAVSKASDGQYDITVKPIAEAGGFNAEERQKNANIDSLMQYVGYEKIRIADGRLIKDNPNVRIDLNSIAKGYTVDLLSELMAARGATDYLVEVGGELVCRGKNPRGTEWMIGVDKPLDGAVPGKDLQEMIKIENTALATSGNYRKYYTDELGQKFVHTINARTGRSRPSNLLSATIVTEKCAVADAYATMMMVIGKEASIKFLKEHEEIQGYLVFFNEQGGFETFASPGFADKMVL